MTIPMAQAGVDMTALDIVPGMLALAKDKAGKMPVGGRPITWLEADARDYHLGRQFALIFENGSVFMHMLERDDQRAFLDRAREHLAPGGRLVVSLFFPHPSQLVTDLEEKEWYTYLDELGRSVRVSGYESYDELRQIKTETAVRRVEGEEQPRVVPLSLRYTFPQEMELLLETAGFQIHARYGGPDQSELTAESQYMVYVVGRGD